MSRGIGRVAATAATAILATTASLPAGEDVFPIVGTYTRGEPCRADGSNPFAILVVITEKEIESSFGICTIMSKSRSGNKIAVQTVCNSFKGSVVSGDVTFTIRDDKNLDVEDADKSFKAVLNKCAH